MYQVGLRTGFSRIGRGKATPFQYCFAILCFLTPGLPAQTTCAAEHPSPGVFICYPNPAENATDAPVPRIFHLSAQANAAKGATISRYRVFLDNRSVFDASVAVPIQTLSIETNVQSPFDSGVHTLRLVVDGGGAAEIKNLQFFSSDKETFCDPFSRVDPRICQLSAIAHPLRWSLPHRPADFLSGFPEYLELYGQNLKRIEADISDAVAIDARGRIFTATHSASTIELRRYEANGSLSYDSLVRSCGNGFVAVTSLAIDELGHAWIAGNTNACFAGTPNALQPHVGDTSQLHGFVLLLDTTQPSSHPPAYFTYLSDTPNRISALGVDQAGNAYVSGMAASNQFPHQSSVTLPDLSGNSPAGRVGFVAALNPEGSGLQWSALVPDAQINAVTLAVDGGIYVTGRAAFRQRADKPGSPRVCTVAKSENGCDDLFIAKIIDRGRRISYLERLGGTGDEEGRAIAAGPGGNWIFVAGATDSPDFPGSTVKSNRDPKSFIAALQPCKTGSMYARLFEAVGQTAPPIAIAPALDAFARTVPLAAPSRESMAWPPARVAPDCRSESRP